MENPHITLNDGLKGPALLIVLAFIITAPGVYAAPVDDVRGSLSQAFGMVAKAESSGGDVSGLIVGLNQAAALVNIGDADSLARARDIINNVKANVERIEAIGVLNARNRYIGASFTLFFLAFSGLLVYFYGSRLYWSLWLRSRKNWRVEAT